MIKIRIGDAFPFIKNGVNIKQERNAEGIPITRIETLSGGVFQWDRLGYANIFNVSNYEEFILADGDILMSHINSFDYLGRSVVYHENRDVGSVIHGMNLLRLKVEKSIILPEYAAYLFRGQTFKESIRKISKKSVNQASFSVTDLKKINI
ncbi:MULTISPECIES: restriction endonuclease subunit S [Bacillota]|uniref:restriction endonuclease subunit S n=1 Tax=Bacillota TaxID=1239 RepID=UPI0023F1D080|nr:MULTISPECIES: restriction endonuclease subunit S [Bacillota]MCI6407511.1 restriction endonuclease subunit S [Veillonella caviae]MDY6231711.1 restriction endonuclease subunit S [Peptostreptococcus porci]